MSYQTGRSSVSAAVDDRGGVRPTGFIRV